MRQRRKSQPESIACNPGEQPPRPPERLYAVPVSLTVKEVAIGLAIWLEEHGAGAHQRKGALIEIAYLALTLGPEFAATSIEQHRLRTNLTPGTARFYRDEYIDVLDQLAQNLRGPSAGNGAPIWVAARAVLEFGGHHPPYDDPCARDTHRRAVRLVRQALEPSSPMSESRRLRLLDRYPLIARRLRECNQALLK